MLKKLLIFIVVVLVGGLVLAVMNNLFFGGKVERAVAPTEESGESGPSTTMPISASNVVVYSDTGFSPSTLTIKSGDQVVFKNESSRQVWPASALHPTHAVYDGTILDQHCAPGAAPSFDSCRGIEPGGEWSFVFNKVGNWKYHDHLNASRTGTIIVE